MRIDLPQPYQAIERLTTVDLPDFALLIGRNGAGKTQLLEALRRGAARIPGIAVEEVELYDMVTFAPHNAGSANRQVSQFAQVTADSYLSPLDGEPPVETAGAIFTDCVSDVGGNCGA